jgi:hypothetical protein
MISVPRSTAYYFLKTSTASSLAMPSVGFCQQPVLKYRGTSFGHRVAGISWPRRYALIRCRWSLQTEPARRVSRCYTSTVRSRKAKRALACSSATSPKGSPLSRYRVISGIVRQTGSMPLTTYTRILSTISICHLFPALTILFLRKPPVRKGRYLLVYHVFVLYRIESSTQVITAFCSAATGGPSLIHTSPRIWLATCCALAARSVIYLLKLSFRSNHTPSQRSASCSLSFSVVVIGWIARLLSTIYQGT